VAFFDFMKQVSLDLNLSARKTRKRVFLEQMDHVVLWTELMDLIAPFYSEGKSGRPPFALQTMLRIHFMQQWFSLSDPAMEEAFFDTPLYIEFAQLPAFGRLPDESTILRFRHRLEKHKLVEQVLATVNLMLEQRGLLLNAGTAVDATLIAAPSSTKNKDKARDPEMHSSQKGNEWHVAMRLGKRNKLDKENNLIDAMLNKVEKIKASFRAKVEHPFRVIKRQFGFTKVRYRGLKKNTLQLKTLFALSNFWMARHKLMVIKA
jgi:IS5 family transposase